MKRVATSPDSKRLALGQQMSTAPVLALVAVEIDQITKLAARESLTAGDSIPLSANLHIANVVNPGIAFGVSVPTAVSLLLPLVMIVASLVLYRRFERSNGALLNVGIGLFVGGSLGNLLDRIVYRHVTDFICLTSSGDDVGWVFNLADVCIIAGIVILQVFLLRLVLKKRKRKDTPAPMLRPAGQSVELPVPKPFSPRWSHDAAKRARTFHKGIGIGAPTNQAEGRSRD